MKQALLVVDVQNEFSPEGKRPVPNHANALDAIRRQVDLARGNGTPIAWIRHHNRPSESAAFVPGSWGAELSPGFGPAHGSNSEVLFEKDVFGPFNATPLEKWLRASGVDTVVIVGFYTHMCVSTTAREALVRGFDVCIDPDGTGARDLEDALLGSQTADEVRRSALLQLTNMGIRLVNSAAASQSQP